MAAHLCHWPGCPVPVPPKLWGCRPHWYRLPVELRVRLMRAYRPGQEVDKQPSEAYIWVAKQIQFWIVETEELI